MLFPTDCAREVLQVIDVERDNQICSCPNCGHQDMAVTGIRELKRFDQCFIADDPDQLWFELPTDTSYGFLQPGFRRYFREWQKTLVSTKPDHRPGFYFLRVGLDPRSWHYSKSWRRLAEPHDTSLDELAMGVLDAFDFGDTDHLYEFRYSRTAGVAPSVVDTTTGEHVFLRFRRAFGGGERIRTGK